MTKANPRRMILEGLFRGETDTKVWEFKTRRTSSNRCYVCTLYFVFEGSYEWLSLDAIGVLTKFSLTFTRQKSLSFVPARVWHTWDRLYELNKIFAELMCCLLLRYSVQPIPSIVVCIVQRAQLWRSVFQQTDACLHSENLYNVRGPDWLGPEIRAAATSKAWRDSGMAFFFRLTQEDKRRLCSQVDS